MEWINTHEQLPPAREYVLGATVYGEPPDRGETLARA